MKRITLVVVMSVMAQPSMAQSNTALLKAKPFSQPDRSWSVMEENDAFGGAGSDSSYTQGVRLLLTRNSWNPSWQPAVLKYASVIGFIPYFGKQFKRVREDCGQAPPSKQARACGSFGFGLGQTEYTPPNLMEAAIQYDRRPYVGYLFVNYGLNALFNRGQVSSDIFVGTIGKWSFAKQTQSLAHWTWAPGSPRPLGWHNQLTSKLQLTLVNSYSYRLLEFCRMTKHRCDGSYDERRIADATLKAETVFGTLMTRSGIGFVGRLGYKFPDVVGVDRVPATKKIGIYQAADQQPGHEEPSPFRAPWAVAFVSVDGRYAQHNSTLSGSLFDRADDSWRKLKMIETKHGVNEVAIGGSVGSDYLTLTYQRIRRSSEYFPSSRDLSVQPGPNPAAHWLGEITFSVHSRRPSSRP